MLVSEPTLRPKPRIPRMCASTASWLSPQDKRHEQQIQAMITRLRDLLLAPPTDIERFYVVFWDSARRVSGMTTLGQGSEAVLTVCIRDLFYSALKAEASAILMAHNHPPVTADPVKMIWNPQRGLRR